MDYKQVFVEFRNELNSFIYRIVNHRQEAEDLVQETYLKAFKKLHTFEGRSTFKTWVFAIATNLARDSQRAKTKWAENWQDQGKDFNQENEFILKEKANSSSQSEHGKFVIREHINFCFTCINKTLLIEQQICLLLKEVYQFKISEIMVITEMTAGKVKHAIADARKSMIRIFQNRCSLINKNGICHQCSELNNLFNPQQDAQIEINKLKLAKSAFKESQNRLFDIRLQLVNSIDPLNAEGTNLHNFIIENCPDWVKIQESKNNNS